MLFYFNRLTRRTRLADIKRKLSSITALSKTYDALSNRLESTLIELSDIQSEMEVLEEKIEHDPHKLSEIADRLTLLNGLIQKHQVRDLKELIEVRASLTTKVGQVENLDDDLKSLASEVERKLALLEKSAASLTSSRTSVFTEIAGSITAIAKELGMPEAIFEIERTQTEHTEHGCDEIKFMFSANKGIATQSIVDVASGGEFSRLMFALKSILAEKASMPTMIFDEIETGVSGEVAKKMVKMLQNISQHIQIISISHLPQFAAQADLHYFVYKDHSAERSVSKIKVLDEQERVSEIAKMIDGDDPSKAALDSAAALMHG